VNSVNYGDSSTSVHLSLDAHFVRIDSASQTTVPDVYELHYCLYKQQVSRTGTIGQGVHVGVGW
jgi:hypothetical protein